NGTPRTATYRITPPGGSWDGPDTGTYTLTLQSGQVLDTSGAPVPAGFIGAFRALIPLTLTVTTATDSGPGSLRDAIAQANASGGGGIRVDGASVTVQDSVITGNSSSGPGGGIYVFFGTVGLTVRNCLISGNTAGTDAASQYRDGGGISVGFGASLLVENSTVSGNTSPTEGGGVYVYRNS